MNIAKLLLLYSKWDSKNEDIQKMPGVYVEVIWIIWSSVLVSVGIVLLWTYYKTRFNCDSQQLHLLHIQFFCIIFRSFTDASVGQLLMSNIVTG